MVLLELEVVLLELHHHLELFFVFLLELLNLTVSFVDFALGLPILEAFFAQTPVRLPVIFDETL